MKLAFLLSKFKIFKIFGIFRDLFLELGLRSISHQHRRFAAECLSDEYRPAFLNWTLFKNIKNNIKSLIFRKYDSKI